MSDQEILAYQAETMRMMYNQVAEALITNGRSHEHPTDYLSFFCLGSRESK